MKAFVITEQGTVEAIPDTAAETPTGLVVKNRQELAKATRQWPASRLVQVWNQLAGVQPVRKFTDRKTALSRIWNALEALEAPAAAPEPHTPAKRSRREDRPTSADSAPRATKTALVLALLRRPGGATLDEIRSATGWQAHSVRGFLSGKVAKRMGLKVTSARRADGSRVYSIVS